MGRVVTVQKIPDTKPTGQKVRELLASLCYHYPQYTLKQAKRLPYKDVILLLRVADQQQASYYHNMTQISASPQSKNGSAVKKLLSFYEGKING